MASTRSKSNRGFSRDDLDEIGTTLLAPVFVVSGIVEFGVGTFSIASINLGDQLIPLGAGVGLSIAAFLSLLTLIAAYLLNDNDFSDFSDFQSYIGYITFGLVAVVAVVPVVAAFVASNLIIGFVVLGTSTVGFAVMSGAPDHF